MQSSRHPPESKPLAVPAVGPMFSEQFAASWKLHWHDFRKAFRRCRRHRSEKNVHDLRTATRKLLAHLELRGGMINSSGFRHDERLLKRVMRSTSPLRDAHVQGERLAAWVDDDSSDQNLNEFHGHLTKRAAKAERKAAKKLKARPDFRAITPKKLYPRPLDVEEEASLLASVNVGLEQAFERVKTLWQDADPDDTEAQHAARIALKKFRYMLEAVTPPHPDRQTLLFLTRLHAAQSTLGQRHDLDLFLSRLERFAKRHDKSSAWMRLQRTKIKRQQRVLRDKQSKQKAQFMQVVWQKPKDAEMESPSASFRLVKPKPASKASL